MSFSPGDEYYIEAIIAVSLFILILLFRSIYKAYKGLQSNQWIRKKAMVTHVSIETSEDEDYDLWHKPKIKYNYFVKKEKYSSTRFSYKNLSTRSYSEISKKINGITIGKEIDIYMNYRNPKQAVIERGINYFNFIEPVFLIIFMLFIVNGYNKHMYINSSSNNQLNGHPALKAHENTPDSKQI